MSRKRLLERLFFELPYGLKSRIRIWLYRQLGLRLGEHCRIENIRIRRPSQIRLGDYNALTEGCWLWPDNSDTKTVRISIGSHNYFNRDVMIDACGSVQIGDHNMFGPRVYITDSNHTMDTERWLSEGPMDRGEVIIGNGCWIGCGAILLKGTVLGDRCIVGAGAVVTKAFPAGSVLVGVPARPLR